MLGNPENERKCIFYLDTKPEVKKRSSEPNKIRERRADLKKWQIGKKFTPKWKSIKEKSFLFCGEMQQYILEVCEHITDATKLAQKICRSVLWE